MNFIWFLSLPMETLCVITILLDVSIRLFMPKFIFVTILFTAAVHFIKMEMLVWRSYSSVMMQGESIHGVGQVNGWMVDELYLNTKFKSVFEEYAREPRDGLYPTMSIRQLMWKLRMKPIKREPWETVFDKCPI